MQKPVLIFYEKDHIAPVGGPAGAIYNLLDGINTLDITNIAVLNSLGSSFNYKKRIFQNLPKFVRHIYYDRQRVKRVEDSISGNCNRVNFSDYAAINFHNMFDLCANSRALENYSGSIIFQSHSPNPLHLEIFEAITTCFYKKSITKYLAEIQKCEEFAFDRSDYIVFPCPEAEEPYYNNWKKYAEIHKRNEHKYRYILTGLADIYNPMYDDLRKQFSIPDDSMIVSYAGRHNLVKGYDTLKNIGEKILAENNNVYFLISGNEFPIKGLTNNRWIEMGFLPSKRNYASISSSDIFILPNRQTYFDLVLLEVLSLGKPILASRTGGNKFFEKINACGITFYDDMEDGLIQLRRLLKKSKDELLRMGEANRQLYLSMFTSKAFAKSYMSFLNTEIWKV